MAIWVSYTQSGYEGGGQSLATNTRLILSRDGNTSSPASVKWRIEGTGLNPADAEDFGGTFPSGTLEFAPFQSATLDIPIRDDDIIEPNEEFTIIFYDPIGDTLADYLTNGAIKMTIANDDALASIKSYNGDSPEGDSGKKFIYFYIELSTSTGKPVSVDWALTGTGANPVDAADFGGTLPSGTVTLVGWETSRMFMVEVSGDTTVEPDETYTITLSNPNGVALGTTTATGTIRNDDTTLSIAALDATKAEGSSGSTAYTFEVTRAGNIEGNSTASYAVTGTGANPADAADFGGTLPSDTVSFAPGETRKVITINVSGDSTREGNETFAVTLTNLRYAPIATATATGTIVNDDIEPTRRLAITSGGTSREVEMQAYSGPVSWLQNMHIGADVSEAMHGTDLADFINTLGGDDAIDGGKGDDVLDGGLGSNFLTGGSGMDTFFVDGRGNGVTWSTVTDLEKGEWVTCWGWKEGTSKLTWAEMAGADGYKGATAHIDLDANGSIDMSMTISSKYSAAVLAMPGQVGDASYLAFTLA
ncbi:Calx-beta domain-containing protein [Azospirillum brasilense]|uniref:Calx-beta domain-containing protein n=1 Tax=Azospirillum baldaniorum TaxID=1064539 RepID=UPI0002D60413|nr:Calx-beta domain-containing protein [Azospirillum baldaniorum]TWA75204.1 Calx-beta domain-containing protein [Azospirillum brasilense]